MLNDYEFWTLSAIGALAFILAGTNMYLGQANGALQARASNRAQEIQESAALQDLYRQVAQALADRAVRTQDQQIRDMLAGEGLNINAPAPSPGPSGKDGKP